MIQIALEDQLDELNAKLRTLDVNTANKQLYEKLTNIKLENVRKYVLLFNICICNYRVIIKYDST